MLVLAITAAAVLAGFHGASDAPSANAIPRVVSTIPKPEAIIEPGPMTLSVTYDHPMRRQSYSFVQKTRETYPDCGRNQPTQSADGRTFTMQCTVLPGRRYEIWFNDPPYMNFASESGVAAAPHRLGFQTR